MLSLSLPCDYQKRGLMGELDGLDLEGAKKLQDASDEVIAQIREDFVQKSSLFYIWYSTIFFTIFKRLLYCL